jgi:threonine/homoserine/homoserine lactone efflux protein
MLHAVMVAAALPCLRVRAASSLRVEGPDPRRDVAIGLTAAYAASYRAPVVAAFLAGAAAGLGIAIPVGAIAILSVETGLRRGFRLGAAAGAGAATVDGIYALVAAAFGAALAAILAPWERPLRVVAVVVLVAIALRGLAGLRARARPAVADGAQIPPDVEEAERGGSAVRTYGVFVAITLLNPVTVTYFAALILGLGSTGAGPAEKAAFVIGAFLASLCWQTLLAAVGAFLHRRLSPRLRTGVIILGNAIILGFALVIARGLFA